MQSGNIKKITSILTEIDKNASGNIRQTRIKATADIANFAKRRAQEITLYLIENNVQLDYIKEKICYISPENYEDIVVERALTDICGYPLCTSKLDHEYDNQKYIIRHNKVYDVTERRNFCSNVCYEASGIIMNQIPDIPLYLRDNDNEIINFKLYVPDRKSLSGKYGKLVNIQGPCFEHEENYKINRSIHKDNSQQINFETKEKLKPCIKKPTNVKLDSSCKSNNEKNTSQSSQCLDEKLSKMTINDEIGRNDISHGALKDKDSIIKNNMDTMTLIIEIEQIMRQWMTFDSLRFILGDNYIKGMLEDFGKKWEDYDTTAGLRLGVESKAKYVSLCKKLDKEELSQEINDRSYFGEEGGKQREMKDVPQFDQLKKVVEQQFLKVKAFYEGQEEFVVKEERLETIAEEESEERKENVKRKEKKKEIDSVSLPLIDSYEQNIWRRKIIFDKLNKPISLHCCQLGLDEGQVRTLMKNLIATFDLSPHNITFTTTQWAYVALFILKMLSIRYPAICETITNPVGCEYVKLQLERIDLDLQYLDRLLSYLTEIVHIIGKGFNKNTKEDFKVYHQTVENKNFDDTNYNNLSPDYNESNKLGNLVDENFESNTMSTLKVKMADHTLEDLSAKNISKEENCSNSIKLEDLSAKNISKDKNCSNSIKLEDLLAKNISKDKNCSNSIKLEDLSKDENCSNSKKLHAHLDNDAAGENMSNENNYAYTIKEDVYTHYEDLD